MNNTIEDANNEHERCQAECEAFKKSGNKIKVGPALISKLEKKTINKKSSAKPSVSAALKHLNPTQKVKAVLAHHKQLTRVQLIELTGLSSVSITRAVRTLEDELFLTRAQAGDGIGRKTLFSVVEKSC